MNAYEYLIKLKDYASSGLRNIAESAGITDRQLQNVDGSMHSVNRTTNLWSGSLRSLRRMLYSVFATVGIGLFITQTINARKEYEKFSAVLTNTFQSVEIGQGALNMLTDFAAKTPFQVNELTDSFVKLVNRGFVPAQNELRKMGDLAASQGKSFGQLTEAILDAETSEFERLKEFGIKAKKAGDSITFSFKGVTKTVRANATSIREAILQYGNLTGVAGSMEAISKTLGGRISNLKDKWWSFLVAVGGESGGIFSGVIDILSKGIAFLTDHLPQISMYFKILWSYIEPVGTALKEFLKATFGFTDANSVLSSFGDTMVLVLGIVDLFTTGLITIIDWLTPFADVIGVVTAAWWVFNTALYASPLTWIVLGIMGIITAIGFVTKYTDGWGESWKHLMSGMKWLLAGFVAYVKYNFTNMVEGLMIDIDKIKRAWYKFKDSVGIGKSSENQKIITEINASIEARKKAIIDGQLKLAEATKKAGDEFSKVGIKIDYKSILTDYKKVTDKFKNLGQKSTGTSAYDNYLANLKKNKDKNKTKSKRDTIVSGGSKQTNINVTIQKLQDDTKIYVNSVEKGIKEMGTKVQEELLRAINSINQMQTN